MNIIIMMRPVKITSCNVAGVGQLLSPGPGTSQ